MHENQRDLSRPKIVNHLFKIVAFGGLFTGSVYCMYQVGEPWMYALLLLGWCFLAAVARNFHALVALPRFVLTHEGLELRYWRVTNWFTLGMFRPWNVMVELSIPWWMYRGCETFKRSGGDPWDAWQALFIETSHGTLTIGWDVFARSVDELMAAVGEYREMELRLPLRKAARVVEFQRRRFVEPLRFRPEPAHANVFAAGCAIFGALVVLVPIGGLIVMGLIAAYKEGTLGIVVAIGGSIIALITTLCLVFRDRRPTLFTQWIEFRAEGLLFGGAREDEEQLVPWEDVYYTRMMERTSDPTSDNPTKWHQLFIHTRDYAPVQLGGLETCFGRTLQEMSDLIDPPCDRVQDAWQHINNGDDVETAALFAGLPARGDTVLPAYAVR